MVSLIFLLVLWKIVRNLISMFHLFYLCFENGNEFHRKRIVLKNLKTNLNQYTISHSQNCNNMCLDFAGLELFPIQENELFRSYMAILWWDFQHVSSMVILWSHFLSVFRYVHLMSKFLPNLYCCPNISKFILWYLVEWYVGVDSSLRIEWYICRISICCLAIGVNVYQHTHFATYLIASS